MLDRKIVNKKKEKKYLVYYGYQNIKNYIHTRRDVYTA